MKRLVGLFCLAATLACPLINQAEAAEGFVRSLAELFEPGHLIEPCDSRVCDDQGTLWNHAPSEWDGLQGLAPMFLGFMPPAVTSSIHPAHLRADDRWGPSLWPPPQRPKRQACLQVFLF